MRYRNMELVRLTAQSPQRYPEGVVAEFLRGYRRAARVADPGVIARPQFSDMMQGRFNIFDPPCTPVGPFGYASGSPVAVENVRQFRQAPGCL
jgi:hypothetical protein